MTRLRLSGFLITKKGLYSLDKDSLTVCETAGGFGEPSDGPVAPATVFVVV